MKKTGAFIIIISLLFLLVPLALAENESQQDSASKIEKGFECLEEKVGDCSELSVQELALTILATPDNVFDDCVNELKSRKSSEGNWDNKILDTALAIIALDHAGEDTTDAEEWLLNQSRTPTDLIWYLQQDSDEAVGCDISYDGEKKYKISIGKDKKINIDSGTGCLKLANSDFWLEIDSDCYNKEFTIECDKEFIATLLYKNENANTIYPLEGTDSAGEFGSIKLKVNSKCFGTGSLCNYEATAWATIALMKKGYDVEEYIPYVIAVADSNKQYLPNAFSLSITSYENYATQLINEQKGDNYWQAINSEYNRFYDTALALRALGGSSSEKVASTRKWLLFEQGDKGCWQNAVRETAIILWALEGRKGKSPAGSKSEVVYCEKEGYFCIPGPDCSPSETLDNYFCGGSLSDVCCATESLKECSEYRGMVCGPDEVCRGNERRATDTDDCCTGECVTREEEENECESMGYYCQEDFCLDTQEEVTAYACDRGEVCCKTKTVVPEEGSTWWIWVLILLISAVLGAIGYIYREKLKLLWFKFLTKFKKDKGRGGGVAPQGPRPPGVPPRPGMPPRPGFPPIRRMPQRAPPPRARPSTPRAKSMSDTFGKLREMSR